MNWLERTNLLIGDEAIEQLTKSHVLVVGLGGVGAYAAEQICRSGVGQMTIVDGDNLHLTNLNRQLPALNSTLGKPKAKVMGERLLDINPNLKLTVIQEYIRDERMKEILSQPYDYVVDAIDTLSPKVFLIYHSVNSNLRIVSSLGSGGKMNPLLMKIADIDESYGCPLGRMLRKRLHRLGIRSGVKVVFSTEEVPENAMRPCENEPNKKTTIGTISYMPPLFGCAIASIVIRDIIGKQY